MGKYNNQYGVRIFSYLFGLIFIGLSIYLYFDFNNINISNSAEAKGKVIKLYNATSSRLRFKPLASDNYSSFLPVVQFTTQSGQQIEFMNEWGDIEAQYSVSEVVDVIYDSIEPNIAQIKRENSLESIHFFLFGLGVFFIIIPKLYKFSQN